MSTLKRQVCAYIGLAMAVLACSPPGSSRRAAADDQSSDSVTAVIVRALAQQLAASDVRVRLDPSRIERRTEVSRVVPGLVYHWAVYRPVGIPHAYSFALAAERGDSVRLIRDAGDWSRAVGDWQPSTTDEARTACLELARSGGRGRDAERAAIPVSQAVREIAAMPRELRARAVRALKDTGTVLAATDHDRHWVVEMWIFELGRSTRYRCVFEGGGKKPAELTVLDSIEGVGWFTTEPANGDSG